ncbi:MAG: valine--tRNA ligase [Candidatus Aenigmarchaeota archaeon]|nr:valine--tRNA ligase [Candidatus Aenigmarchaeota archaeon]
MKLIPKIKEKVWEPSLELKILRSWEKGKIYKFNPKSKKPIFSVDTPPPYPSGAFHVGAAAHYSQIDMIARTARMLGYEVYFPMGIDRNGVPVEKYTEKKYGIKLQDTSREKFINLCKTALDELENEMIRIMERMGISADLMNYYCTDAIEYRTLTQATFIELWKRGLIYEATRPSNYCYDCRTTIADADVEYLELSTELVYMKFSLEDMPGEIVVASTRPELLCSCQAILVNPRDKRYLHLHNKHVLIPIYDRMVSIIPHPAANPKFGSGVVMVCSYGDFEDVRLFRELNLKEIVAIDEEGRLTKAAGVYSGLPVEVARRKIIEDLERKGRLAKREKITHRIPVCERSGVPIEIIPMKEFYLKQLKFREKIKELAKKLVFHPEHHRQRLFDWIESIAIDWPITRRRYYGTEVPIWYCSKCGKPNLPSAGKYYQPWKEKPPFKKCKFCGNKKFYGDIRTFDTWFDSSISPLFISKFLKDKNFFKKTFPNTMRPQGYEIIRTWLYYTLLRCYQLAKKPAFSHVWISGLGVDEKGEKMSKSKSNIVFPLPILQKYGGDAFRLWNAGESSLGEDFRYSEQKIIDGRKFLTKLWNIARFISAFPEPKKAKLSASDKWILAELNQLIEKSLNGHRDFNFFIPINSTREFTWNIFADHYLELIKARAYGQGFNKDEQMAAWYTLHTCLKALLKLLAPIIPFITDHIWRSLYSKKSIHREIFLKKVKVDKKWAKFTEKLIDFNSQVWNEKKRRKLSLKSEIDIKVPPELQPFEKDLKAMHNLKY